jgi:hypothetical protein
MPATRPDRRALGPCAARRPRPASPYGRSRPATGALLGIAAACALAACGEERTSPPPEAPSTQSGPDTAAAGSSFPDLARERGLAHVNLSGEADKATILEANGAGVALLDLGSDGDLDVVFSQGLGSLAALIEGPGADLAVFHNDGTGHFEAVGGPGLSGWWTGLATGDLDGDGDADLVAGGFGALEVLLQDDRGRLVPLEDAGTMPDPQLDPSAALVVGQAREPGRPPLWTTSLATVDLDRDGFLDLYVGQYLDLDPVAPPIGELGSGALAVPCIWKGYPVYCGPRGMDAQPDRVLRGLGDGRFVDVSEQWLPDHRPGFTLGVLPFDADGDGDSDLYVANDSVANLLLINEGTRLVDVAPTAGVALNQDGMPEAGMGVACGDVDRDGRLDLAVTNFSDEPTQLFLATDTGFRTMTHELGLGYATKRLLSWGVHLVDFDGDGWLELFTANGHVYPQADLPATGTRYGQPDTLWRLLPWKRAQAVEADGPGSILARASGTRGSAVGDLDGDGAPDLVTVTIDGPAGLGLNRRSPDARRLVVRLEGSGEGEGSHSPRDGQGARVVLVPGDESYALLGELHTAAGYQSAGPAELYFGLGTADRFALLEVRWPSGRIDRIEGGATGRRLTIAEGRGLVAESPLAR